MRIITLEEHISFPEMVKQIPKEILSFGNSPVMEHIAPKLADITGERLQSMNNTGITMQVLSVDTIGANLLSAETGPAFAMQYNDLVAQKIAGHRDRFTAFAHLPTSAPMAAADELERTVKEYNFRGAMISGVTQNKFMDAPEFAPIFERAEKLGVPIYLHPAPPPKAVADVYYSGFAHHTGILESIAC